jgi:hypothetical protein
VVCEGCRTEMTVQVASEAEAGAEPEPTKWKCPQCGSWCLTQDGDVVMAAWLLEGREWPR